MQAFGVDPPGWAKYVQLRLLTHYGSEPVCALNDVRVYGKSAAEDLEDRLALEAASDDEEAMEAASSEENAAAGEECSTDEAAEQQGAAAGVSPEEAQSREQAAQQEIAAKEADAAAGSKSEGQAGAGSGPGSEQEQRTVQSQTVGDVVAQPVERENQAGEAVSGAELESGGGSGDLQSAAQPPNAKAAIPPVLDILSEGLLRLIAPPGAGKKRSAYSGEPADPQALPQPDPPLSTPDAER